MHAGRGFGKGASALSNRSLDLTQNASGYAVRSVAQYGHGLRRVKIHDTGKIGGLKKALGIVSAAHKRLIRRAVCEAGFKPCREAEFIQFFQQAVRRVLRERGEVRCIVFRSGGNGGIQNKLGDGGRACAEMLLQHGGHSFFVALFQFPARDLIAGIAVGVRDVEHIANAPPGVRKQGNALGTAVDPAPQRVPLLQRGAGGGRGLLCVDEKLVREAVFIVVARRLEEGGIGRCAGGYVAGLLLCQCENVLRSVRHVRLLSETIAARAHRSMSRRFCRWRYLW